MISNLNISDLREIIKLKEKELKELKILLQQKELSYVEAGEQHAEQTIHNTNPPDNSLTKEEISRYSRQIILPKFGVKGQSCLKQTSVLIVGAGGLGCPAGQYLAAAGIGTLGIIDYDDVETSNLHRQVLHSQTFVNHPKVLSFAAYVNCLNPNVKCIPYKLLLNRENIQEVLPRYDIVLDATDNPATRYLLSDACVKYGKPLVSGSALRMEGQLTVYNYKNGPCYRCFNPEPPKSVTNCSEGGVLGAVPGFIGTLQAIEAIKIAIGMEPSFNRYLLVFDGEDGTFRKIRLRDRQPNCIVCSRSPEDVKLIDYVQFCGSAPNDKETKLDLLNESQRLSCKDYFQLVEERKDHLLLDVRPQHEFEICSLPASLNIPYKELEDNLPLIKEKCASSKPVVVVCRRGNDSQRAVQLLSQRLNQTTPLWIKDIRGGLTAWAKEVDPNFPLY